MGTLANTMRLACSGKPAVLSMRIGERRSMFELLINGAFPRHRSTPLC
jgi:hypothetical protein